MGSVHQDIDISILDVARTDGTGRIYTSPGVKGLNAYRPDIYIVAVHQNTTFAVF